jgi:3'-phosphoadenosine 5'-phosphosulfate (PAPS) 3'-phosphatase
MFMKIDLEKLLKIAVDAGEAILVVYNNPQEAGLVKLKTDESPLTLADEASHLIIQQGLEQLTPEIPILSEEGAANAPEWIAIGSRSHASPDEQAVLQNYPVVKSISAGSSLKFCYVAEGKAHIYYRHGPTMEWDTAAGQAIVTGSGGTMSMPNGEPFVYNKPSLLNSGFICKVN